MIDSDCSKVAFISCVNDEDIYNECLLYLRSLHIPEGMSVEYIPVRGASSMCAGYNEGARQTNARYKVYLHLWQGTASLRIRECGGLALYGTRRPLYRGGSG